MFQKDVLPFLGNLAVGGRGGSGGQGGAAGRGSGEELSGGAGGRGGFGGDANGGAISINAVVAFPFESSWTAA